MVNFHFNNDTLCNIVILFYESTKLVHSIIAHMKSYRSFCSEDYIEKIVVQHSWYKIHLSPVVTFEKESRRELAYLSMLHVVSPESTIPSSIGIEECTKSVTESIDKLAIVHVSHRILRLLHALQQPDVLSHAMLNAQTGHVTLTYHILINLKNTFVKYGV